MSNIPLLRRKKGLKKADELAAVMDGWPDIEDKRAVFSVVTNLRKKYGRTYEEKRAEVFKVLQQYHPSVLSFNDLQSETGIRPADLSAIMKDLETSKMIEALKLQTSGRPQRVFKALK
jgi:hypothetical protein